MLEGHHLSHSRKANDRGTFPTAAVAFDQVETTRRKNEEATVDQPAVAARLFDKGRNCRALAFERAVAPRRPDRRKRRTPRMAKVEFDRRADIHGAQPVAISEAECRLVLDVAGNALEAPARQCVLASVDQRPPPRPPLFPVSR